MEVLDNFISFCELFEKIAKKFPSEKAVIFNSQSISYSQLDEHSTELAKELICQGAQRGDIIALGLYNDLDLITALLSIWKANGVYLPIDPNYPEERIKIMLKDANPKLLITKRSLKDTFNFFSGKTHFIDDKHQHDLNVELKNNFPNDIAYIMYTSGSTGSPKGIMVEHGALRHAAFAFKELHPEKTVSLICGSISFDVSLLTIIHTFIVGGTVCLYDNRNGVDIDDTKELANIINRNCVRFILTTPFFYSKLLNEEVKLLSLRNVDLCGESLSTLLVKKHLNIAPNAFLFNLYGPTEYAMGSTAANIYNPQTQVESEISIGKSFSCNEIYILDSAFNKSKPLEKGEIFVGGPGLARGYKNLKKLTEEKFVWLKSSEGTPIRLFRTGDLGYYLPNGNISFVGRNDFQLKIRGHRVELEEVEFVINECPEVKKSVLVVNKDPHEGMQLIAFFSASDKLSEEDLKDFLNKKLPSFMLPSRYIRIQDWPTLVNGKINRERLHSLLNI